MTLVSNQENTVFQSKGEDGQWVELGKGKILTIRVARGKVCEIAAKPDGFRRQSHVLATPVRDLRFTFWDPSDRETQLAALAPVPVPAPRPPPVTRPPPVAHVPSGTARRWAVVVGVSQYKDHRIPTLRYASRDAKEFHAWITAGDGGRYAPANVRLLLDQDATMQNIRDALFQWLTQALEEDVVTIYFSGHGTPESPDRPNNLFLVPYDADYDRMATTGFPMWDVETALQRFVKARKVIVIADACHAGGVGAGFENSRRAIGVEDAGAVNQGLQGLAQVNDGVAVITSAGSKQLSRESQEWGSGHGVFTYYLLEGLKGAADYNRDGHVTLGELIPYLSEQVRRQTRNAQSPEVAGKFDPALTLGN